MEMRARRVSLFLACKYNNCVKTEKELHSTFMYTTAQGIRGENYLHRHIHTFLLPYLYMRHSYLKSPTVAGSDDTSPHFLPRHGAPEGPAVEIQKGRGTGSIMSGSISGGSARLCVPLRIH